MIISHLNSSVANGVSRVEARICFDAHRFPVSGNREETLFFEWPSHYAEPQASYDPFALVGLTLAGESGENLLVDGEISEQLYLNLLEASAIYSWYFPSFSPVEIDSKLINRPKSTTNRT